VRGCSFTAFARASRWEWNNGESSDHASTEPEVVVVNPEPDAPVQAREYSPEIMAGLARLTGRTT